MKNVHNEYFKTVTEAGRRGCLPRASFLLAPLVSRSTTLPKRYHLLFPSGYFLAAFSAQLAHVRHLQRVLHTTAGGFRSAQGSLLALRTPGFPCRCRQDGASGETRERALHMDHSITAHQLHRAACLLSVCPPVVPVGRKQAWQQPLGLVVLPPVKPSSPAG